MQQTTDLDEARRWHDENGGILLQTGMPSSDSNTHHYTVCSGPEAETLGRTPIQLAALFPHFDETK